MKVRADIANLIREGHTDAHVAHRLGCHRNTVSRVRHALRLPPSDPIKRLLAEELPIGRVRDYRPGRMPTSEAQAAANRARLLAALRETPATESEAA